VIPIAIDHHACISRLGSERAEAFARRPMGGRLVALEQASRTQQQRAATDRSDELGASAARVGVITASPEFVRNTTRPITAPSCSIPDGNNIGLSVHNA